MTRNEISRAAHLIAVDLFTIGDRRGRRADRLVLTSKDGRDMGGWVLEPMRDRIQQTLELVARETAPKKRKAVK